MEEVDSIILHFLRQLNIEIKDDVTNICTLTEETIIESASKCISAIDPNLKVPLKLPPGVSQRIEVASHVAAICKDLGYKNDVGYQTFLYHNENDLRQVFMFLIEKLPREDKKISKAVTREAKPSLFREISNKIGEDLNSIWIPPCCKSNNKNYKKFCVKNDHADKSSEIINILARINELKNVKKIKDETVNVDNEDWKVEERKVQEEETNEPKQTLKELKENTIFLRQKLDLLESEKNVMDMEYSQALKMCERSEADLQNIQNTLMSIGVTDTDSVSENLMEEANEHIAVLHRQSEEITSKNMSLKLEIEKIENAKSLNDSDRNKCKKILISVKETAKSMKEECEKKEELRNQLKQRYEKLKSGNKRNIYTKRIIEIIGNVDKQNAEIKKILEDTRQLQKEINTLEGQLERCFAVADETLFKDAKKDDQAKKAYKLLALLHSECNTIVSLVNETGTLSRDIVDLEDNIKTEKSKRTEDVLQKIKIDLAQLQNEMSNQ
ncbi:coiled-coil domain-containing protein 22 homolog [Aricia agestis]|uniref:coiled-coil domain-containing protein 22 homolog n=1 Tax=Aricia agestis TaxID=91739 RepID=UPI001C20AA8A|nr:coiled-coil domain-containing protein 22 homolog [Aricia agestis]